MPMYDSLSRRGFLGAAAAAVAGGTTSAAMLNQEEPSQASTRPDVEPATQPAAPPVRPVVISSGNGMRAVARAMEMLKAGSDPLDAVVAGVQIQEDDPNDHSVGYGGLPNEEGIVELDASVMHGPTHKAGAVAALRNVRHAARVALTVMRRSDHVLLVGEGALKFARAHGFKEEDLLTEESRRIWLAWKENLSGDDDWLAPATAPANHNAQTRIMPSRPFSMKERPYGTINCCAVTADGDIGGVTTTSGLAFKLPGRVGDSPIIGAGLYVDNAVGAAGSTGRGEANLQNLTSFAIVELMRNGMSPVDACLESLKRIADRTEPRLRDAQGRPAFDLKVYCVAKDGRHASASIWDGGQYAVHDGVEAKLLPAAYLFERAPKKSN